jgi:glycosyltransferase involved in cell wall biosynthesis
MIQLSIISAVYNTAEYLPAHLKSILDNSSRIDWELIIVNDGSKDNSKDILEQYRQCYPSLKIIHKNNEGLSYARKSGWEVAQGKYIWFVDSDDQIAPGSIDNILNNLYSDYDLYLYDLMVIKKNGEFKIKGSSLDHQILDKKLLSRNLLTFSLVIKVIKSELINSEYFTNLSIGEDLFLTYNLIPKLTNLIYYPQVIYFYYIRSVSMTRKYSEKWLEREKILDLLSRRWMREGVYKEYKMIFDLIRLDLSVDVCISSLTLNSKNDARKVLNLVKRIDKIDKYEKKFVLLVKVVKKTKILKFIIFLFSRFYYTNMLLRKCRKIVF